MSVPVKLTQPHLRIVDNIRQESEGAMEDAINTAYEAKKEGKKSQTASNPSVPEGDAAWEVVFSSVDQMWTFIADDLAEARKGLLKTPKQERHASPVYFDTRGYLRTFKPRCRDLIKQ
jgi:hypothetical protein